MDEQKYGIPSITPPKQCSSSGFFKLCILVIIIYVFIFLAGIVLVSVGKDNIRKNWVKYRCNPMIIPFAKFFGKDSKKTMRVCTGMIAKSQSKSLEKLRNLYGFIFISKCLFNWHDKIL